MTKYNLNLKELSIHYSKNDIKIIKKYQPYTFLKEEYYNHGYGDSGYNIYLKVDKNMINEKWDTGFVETYSIDKTNEIIMIDKAFLTKRFS